MYIGTAGWTIPKIHVHSFPGEGSHLERYAAVLDAAEINTSFYRPHKPSTYERWGNIVPAQFRFSVKVPKIITHTRRLKDTDELLRDFLSECSHLGTKLGPLLIQLPPSLTFHAPTADAFFSRMRDYFEGHVVCEPRHATWFAPEVDSLLSAYQVTRVAADPSVVPEALLPGGWSGLVYYRLHGSPRIYYSRYSPEYLGTLAEKLKEAKARGAQVWCIFDNTAEGAAAGDALAVMRMTDKPS
jgi:uncharacterized protein YecE (DUF72 family)